METFPDFFAEFSFGGNLHWQFIGSGGLISLPVCHGLTATKTHILGDWLRGRGRASGDGRTFPCGGVMKLLTRNKN